MKFQYWIGTALLAASIVAVRIEENTDYFGNDIASTKREVAVDCAEDCKSNQDCVVAVWYNGICYLKNKIGERSDVGGAKAVFPDRPGNDQGGHTIKDVHSVYGYSTDYRRGNYNMVTEIHGCQKRVEWSEGRIAPYHEQVSFIFRGPMDIYNIAIFQPDGEGWASVSTYNRWWAKNMVFMNNANPQKFNGLSPQGYATPDGVGFSEYPQQFNGRLNDGTNPSDPWSGPGVTTGAEVNIMLPHKCNWDSCKGYFDKNYGLQGWAGSKIFVAKVQMDRGGIPAIWLLNAQVLRSNQYDCNCRGRADPGGCGELDIAEAIYAGTDTLATHNYYLNENPSYGHDTWATRPTNGPATIVAVLDKGTSTIKVLKVSGDDFQFFDRERISFETMYREVISRSRPTESSL